MVHLSSRPQKGRVKRKRNTQEEIEQAVLDFYKQQEENPTLEEIFTAWNDDRLAEKEICEATHSRNQRDFDRYFADIKDRKIKSVIPAFMENFLEEITGNSYADAQIKQTLGEYYNFYSEIQHASKKTGIQTRLPYYLMFNL